MSDYGSATPLQTGGGNVYYINRPMGFDPITPTTRFYEADPVLDAVGNGDEPMNGPTREEIDAKLALSEARFDAKFADIFRQFESRLVQHIDAKVDRIDNKVDAISDKVGGLATNVATMDARMQSIEIQVSGLKSTVVTTAIASVLAIMGIIAAMMAYGSQWFGLGMDASNVAQQAAERALLQQPVASASPIAAPSSPPTGS